MMKAASAITNGLQRVQTDQNNSSLYPIGETDALFDIDCQELLNPEEKEEFQNFLLYTDQMKENLFERPKLFDTATNTFRSKYKFRLCEVNNDNLSLYSSVLCGLDRVDEIVPKRLRGKVIGHIIELSEPRVSYRSHETDGEYCTNIEEDLEVVGEPELHALASLYPKYLFCVISAIFNGDEIVSTIIYKYVKDIKAYDKCIFVLYNGRTRQYQPLYLYNKIDGEEEKNKFKYHDIKMRELLCEFIEENLHYYGAVKFEEVETSDENCILIENENDGSDRCKSIKNNNLLESEINDDDSMDICTGGTKISASTMNKGANISLKIKQRNFEQAYEFVKKPVIGDGHCLFSSLINVLHPLKATTYKSLRKEAADFIRQSDEIDDDVLHSETRQNRKDYCDTIEQTNTYGGELELWAIGKLYKTIIRVVSVVKGNRELPSVSITEFPKDEPLFENTVYILYGEEQKHYDSLHLTDVTYQRENWTKFHRDNEAVSNLLLEFIRDKLYYPDDIQFNITKVGQQRDLIAHIQSVNGTTNVSNLPVINSTSDLSRKRKLSKDEQSPFLNAIGKKSSSSELVTNKGENVLHSTSHRSIPANDRISPLHIGKESSNNVDNFLRIDDTPFPQPTYDIGTKQKQSKNFPNASLSSKTTPIHEEIQPQIRFEIEPIAEFRARLLSDYLPKRKKKRNGTESKIRPPTYFSDQNNNHSLNLLVCYFYTKNIEVCIVTRTINGWIYINPLFGFYKHETDSNSITSNPILIKLGSNVTYKLKEYSEELVKLILYLAVIILKNDEVLQKQPIQQFKSVKSNGIVNTTKYDTSDALKNAFHMNDLRFAITPWIKKTREDPHCQCPELQYISQISTHNKNFKVSKKQILKNT